MKLTLNFSLIFITILSTNLKAQLELDFRRAKLGFILGPNFSKVHHAHNPLLLDILFLWGLLLGSQ